MALIDQFSLALPKTRELYFGKTMDTKSDIQQLNKRLVNLYHWPTPEFRVKTIFRAINLLKLSDLI